MDVSEPSMPRFRQTGNDIATRLPLGLLPLPAWRRTLVAQELPIPLTINAHGFECRRVFQDENNYRFGYESALICNYHILPTPL
jgi:hypothetical protein